MSARTFHQNGTAPMINLVDQNASGGPRHSYPNAPDAKRQTLLGNLSVNTVGQSQQQQQQQQSFGVNAGSASPSMPAVNNAPQPPRQKQAKKQNETRTMSVIMNQPGSAPIQQHQQNFSSGMRSPTGSVVGGPRKQSAPSMVGAGSVVSVAQSVQQPIPGSSQPTLLPHQLPHQQQLTKQASSSNAMQKQVEPAAPAPKTMADAMQQFSEARRNAQSRVKFNLSATQRLINGLADVTVALLTRAMAEEIFEVVELRIYKKPMALPNGGYAVGEYRNGKKQENKLPGLKKVGGDGATTSVSAVTNNESGEAEFIIIEAGELLPGEAGQERDIMPNWMQWFDLVQKTTLWWRYCLAVHKRVGWKANMERNLLNLVDSRLLGYVTITIANYV